MQLLPNYRTVSCKNLQLPSAVISHILLCSSNNISIYQATAIADKEKYKKSAHQYCLLYFFLNEAKYTQ